MKPKNPCLACPFRAMCVVDTEYIRWCFIRILMLQLWAEEENNV